jgi:cell division septal protein FtsQ
MNKLKGQSMNNQRRFLRIFFVLTFFGVMNFLAVLSSPAWANIRGVDIVRTISIGMNFGGAIVSFVAYFRGGRSS